VPCVRYWVPPIKELALVQGALTLASARKIFLYSSFPFLDTVGFFS
jgi:hypothetical protein